MVAHGEPVSLKAHLEDVLSRLGFDEELAPAHARALSKVIRSKTLEATPFAILIPFSDTPPVFSAAVNSFRVRAELGLTLVIDLVALKRDYENDEPDVFR